MSAHGALFLATAVMLAGGAIAGEIVMKGVESPARARQNYILQCQGCHRANAGGDAASTPPMAGIIGKFLSVDGGRAYLGQVPGVATAALGDAEVAELLNWTLYRFDPDHIPKDFTPYTAAEIGKLRTAPLRTEAKAVRAALVAQVATINTKWPETPSQ